MGSLCKSLLFICNLFKHSLNYVYHILCFLLHYTLFNFALLNCNAAHEKALKTSSLTAQGSFFKHSFIYINPVYTLQPEQKSKPLRWKKLFLCVAEIWHFMGCGFGEQSRVGRYKARRQCLPSSLRCTSFWTSGRTASSFSEGKTIRTWRWFVMSFSVHPGETFHTFNACFKQQQMNKM